jgi:predicted DNA-binding protein (MmcQ/YjbR family)
MATAKKTTKKKAPAAKKSGAKKAGAKKAPLVKKAVKTAVKKASSKKAPAEHAPPSAPAKATRASRAAEAAQAKLAEYALSLPQAYADHPWGELVAKVNKKVFVFLGKPLDATEDIGFSVKLPISGVDALELPFTTPTGYGLGKAGWVSVRFPAEDGPPMDEFFRWIDESYRAVAPKKLAAALAPR